MGKDIRVNRSPTPNLNELIKLAIGTRRLGQVEEESGISHQKSMILPYALIV